MQRGAACCPQHPGLQVASCLFLQVAVWRATHGEGHVQRHCQLGHLTTVGRHSVFTVHKALRTKPSQK